MISSHIIKFASDTSNYGIKKEKDHSLVSTSKNKICGDKITIEIEVVNKTIKRMYYETESCIFCQASASLLSKLIKNKSTNSLSLLFKNILENKDFKKILKNKERINCVMLPFDALQKAVNNT